MNVEECSRVTLLVGALLAFGASGLAVADDDDIHAALAGMDAALAGQNFQGTFIQVQGEQVETLQVTHRGVGDDPRERLVSLTGSMRELIRERDTVRCIHSRDAGGEVDMRQSATRFHAHLGKQLKEVDDSHYELISLGRDRIAGRDSRVLGIRPKDGYRYGFVFWLDEETGMPLRSDMLEPQGDVIQKVMFTEIDFPDDIADEAFRPSLNAESERFSVRRARVSQGQGSGEQVLPEWAPDSLPAGFRPISAREKRLRRGGVLHHLVLSDGLSQVSVFIEPQRSPEQTFEGESRMGTVNASGRLVEQHQVTVVGEAPKATIQAIARAFDPLPGMPVAEGEQD